jgi:hypothetical protein
MPYISEDSRKNLDECIDQLVSCIKSNLLYPDDAKNLWNMVGDINYCFSRVLGQLMGSVSYPKIAIITGVLENIKQEFYRRVASPYEDNKIVVNGDIKEYKKLK